VLEQCCGRTTLRGETRRFEDLRGMGGAELFREWESGWLVSWRCSRLAESVENRILLEVPAAVTTEVALNPHASSSLNIKLGILGRALSTGGPSWYCGSAFVVADCESPIP
jgi:hypothetical protein